MTRIARLILLIVAAAASAGCGLLGEESDPTRDWSAQRLYDTAKSNLDRGAYEEATDYYDKLEVRYPFGPLAMQAQLDLIYAYYKSDKPSEALAAADRFIKLHPRHPNVDYAYYLKGLVRFEQGKSLLDRFVAKDLSQHDAGTALQSFRAFEELVQRFPASRYGDDSRQRMVYLKNLLAMHEIHVARWYLKREAWLASANRARHVIENYQGTPAVADALAVLALAYRKLELNDLSADAARVLRLNFPDHAGPDEANR